MTTDAVGAVESMDDRESVDDTEPVGSAERSECRCADEIVVALHRDAERVERRELEEAIGRLEARGDLGDAGREAVEEMADSIVEGFLAGPTESLRGTPDWSTIHTALRLFEPTFETDGGSAHPEGPATSEGSND